MYFQHLSYHIYEKNQSYFACFWDYPGKIVENSLFCAKFTEIAAQYKAFSLPCGGDATGEKRAGARMCSCPWRNNYEDKSKHGNLACGENSHISPDESLIKGVTCPVHTPSHSRRLLPRTARLCRLLALGFPRIKQYLIVLASSLRAANANPAMQAAGLALPGEIPGISRRARIFLLAPTVSKLPSGKLATSNQIELDIHIYRLM